MNTLRQNLEIARARAVVVNAYPHVCFTEPFELTPELMRWKREAHGLTQEEVAGFLMISREVYCKIENGVYAMSPRVAFIARIIFSKL